MPADDHSNTQTIVFPYHHLVGFIAGVFSFAILSFIFPRIGVAPITALILAGLMAVAIGSFVYRVRVLSHRLAQSDRRQLDQLALSEGRIRELYTNSVACLVTFDAGNFILESASPGFFDMLGMPAKQVISGHPLHDVLGVEVTQLASIVHKIRTGTVGVREEIVCKRYDGKSVKLLFGGSYLSQLHLIEAALYRLSTREQDVFNYELAIVDLERFQKGMVRRENRVLELKCEVNELLKEARRPARYEVDATTDDSRFVHKAVNLKKAVKDG